MKSLTDFRKTVETGVDPRLSYDSIQILLNLTQFIALRTQSYLEGSVWSHHIRAKRD